MKDVDSRDQSTDDAGRTVEDCELLRRYSEMGSEEAFAELVRRRIGLVYSVALRQTRGDRHRAEDATQAVFTDLARKAGSLAQRPVLAGWLHRSAEFAAAGLIRAEQRRQAREQKAHTMEKILAPAGAEPDWDQLRPVLDQALNEIDERDRDAILLRFFDGRPFADIGARLRLTENAARMRVERALDKLNGALARRGITSTTAALSMALGHQIGAAMPAGLATTVTGAALAQTAAATGGWLATIMSMSKLQVGIASAVAVAGATGYMVKARNNAQLRREIAALHEPPQAIAKLRAENQQLASIAAEVDLLRRDDVELKQLAQSVAEVQKTNAENARLGRIRESERSKQQNVQAEIDRMNREGNALVEQYKAIVAKSKDPSVTVEGKAQADAEAKLKMAAIQAKQREVRAFIESTGGTVPPQFQTADEVARRKALRAEANAANGASEASGEIARVSLKMPESDHHTALAAIEAISGIKITRDPSIAHVRGMLTSQSGSFTKAEAVLALRTALRDQLNIILEPAPDGNLVAKLGPPR